MIEIIGTFEWEGESYLRVTPVDPADHCKQCHFNTLYECPQVKLGGLHCMKDHGGGCFMTKDELIKARLKGEA